MDIVLDAQKSHNVTDVKRCDVVVLGAGPYGLSAAAHLQAYGLHVITFGKPIYYWRQHMPRGMVLRSYWWATSLSDPARRYTFERYFQENGGRGFDPLPIETFIDYGLWFQRNAVPTLDETYISHIERRNQGFLISLEDGRSVECHSVIMAPGLHYYSYIPELFAKIPPTLLSHTADHNDPVRVLSGKRVAIIGAGQAALETATLMHEGGVDVQVITRKALRWLAEPDIRTPPFISALLSPVAGTGNGWNDWIQEKYPYLLSHVPPKLRDRIVETMHGPAGAHWLRPRFVGRVPHKENVHAVRVETVNDRARLYFSDTTIEEYDHILLGTGYRPDVKRLTMLDGRLIDAIQTYYGSPLLNHQFESSVPGLYFLGFSSVRSFGPFFRFVVGTRAAALRVSRAVAHKIARV